MKRRLHRETGWCVFNVTNPSFVYGLDLDGVVVYKQHADALRRKLNLNTLGVPCRVVRVVVVEQRGRKAGRGKK